MRILMNKWVGGAWGFITESIVNALKDKGHVVERYNGEENHWHRFDPDLYIGCSGHRQVIPPRRRAMVAIHVNPYTSITIPGINESPDAIEWVKSQKPDVVFGYGTQQDSIFWKSWLLNLGIPWVPMPTAGDKLQFKDLGRERANDIIYLGGRWTYKAKTIDEYLFPVFDEINCTKEIRGWGGWPDRMRVKTIDDSEVNNFLNTGLIGPCMSEEHTQKFGIDIPERAFKLALCGVCAIHDPVPAIKNLVPSLVVSKDAKDYKQLIEYYVKHRDEATEIAKKQQQEVLASNTYHHRCAALFESLGLYDDAKKMLT